MDAKVCYMLMLALIVLVYLIFETRKSIYALMGRIGSMITEVTKKGNMSQEEFTDKLDMEVNKTISHIGAFLKLAVFLVFVAFYVILIK